jgi:hypothetical protein
MDVARQLLFDLAKSVIILWNLANKPWDESQ